MLALDGEDMFSVKVGQLQWRRLRCLGMCMPLLLHPAAATANSEARNNSAILRLECFIAVVTQESRC